MIWSLCFTVFAATIGEYIVHRWWMHTKGTSFYVPHHVEHHGHDMNEKHHMGLWQNMNYIKVWLGILPLNLLMCYLVWKYHLVLWAVFQLWWFWSWEFIHRAIHDEEDYRWGKWLLPWYALSKKHHLNHHIKTTTNYGAIFFWSDYLFGTVYKRSS